MKGLSQKSFLLVVLLGVCLIGLLLLLLQLRSTTANKSRATGEAISFSLTPSTQNILLGQATDYRLSLNAYTNIITGVDITLKFDPTLIQNVQWTASSTGLSTAINDGIVNYTDGTIRYSAVEISNSTLTSSFDLGTISLTPKALGTGSLSLVKAQVTAQGLDTALPVTQMSPASYTVVNPTPTSVLGNLSGNVINASSVGIGGSKISLSGNGIKKSTTTNSSGAYSISGIKPGTYKMSVSASHYVSVTTSITIYSSQTTTQNITLTRK